LVVQAAEGDVDRNGRHGQPGAPPRTELPQRLLEDGLVYGGDEVERLSFAQEGCGQEDTAVRVPPAREGFDAHERERVRIEERLVDREELVALDAPQDLGGN